MHYTENTFGAMAVQLHAFLASALDVYCVVSFTHR